MIIQIRGTSGSGKTTVMRRIMDSLGFWNGQFVEGRKKPLYYCNDDNPRLIVLGHYEATCGGCDNIGSAAKVFETIHRVCPTVEDVTRSIVLCEGLLLSEDTKWSLQLPDLRVCFLTTDLDRCLKQVEGRRRAAGNTDPLDPENTSRRVSVIERARVKLTEAGVYCRRASPEQAPGMILNWIGCTQTRR